MTHDASALGAPPPDLGDRVRCAVFCLPAIRRAVRDARRNVWAQFRDWGIDPDDCEAAALVMSELFTNALIHTASAVISCRLGAIPGQLLIEVTDDGEGQIAPRPRRVALDEEGGRGLMLVESVSERWGAGKVKDGDGSVVWAALCSNSTMSAAGLPVNPTSQPGRFPPADREG